MKKSPHGSCLWSGPCGGVLLQQAVWALGCSCVAKLGQLPCLASRRLSFLVYSRSGRSRGDLFPGVDFVYFSSPPVAVPALEVKGSYGIDGRCTYLLLLA